MGGKTPEVKEQFINFGENTVAKLTNETPSFETRVAVNEMTTIYCISLIGYGIMNDEACAHASIRRG
jgi:hypothetical protein